jgi:hypothetical protein
VALAVWGHEGNREADAQTLVVAQVAQRCLLVA